MSTADCDDAKGKPPPAGTLRFPYVGFFTTLVPGLVLSKAYCSFSVWSVDSDDSRVALSWTSR